MSTETLVLRGLNGVVEGETFALEYGKTVTVGRSRKVEISLKKCKKYKELTQEQRRKDEEFLKVSRQHLKISFYNSQSIELEDKSANGTFVDGLKIEKLVISDIKDRPRELTLGPHIKFSLEWGTVETAQQLAPAAEEAKKPDSKAGEEAKKPGSKIHKAEESKKSDSKNGKVQDAKKPKTPQPKADTKES